MTTAAPRGRLACVGLGMMLGAHLGPRARAHIEQADVVFVAASDALVEQWVLRMRPDARSLQPHYAEGRSRHATYRAMVAAMLDEVRAGRHVCGAFYGHPGVFAQVPHEAIAQAREAGFEAVMEPGVSAADCLYADLGLDPGRVGCQHYEANHFLFNRHAIDPTAYLVLWQVAIAGDRSCRRFASMPEQRRLLVDRLLEDYPAEHVATVYEAATLPVGAPRIEPVRLSWLARADLRMASTLVIPPARTPVPDARMIARADALAARLYAPIPEPAEPALSD